MNHDAQVSVICDTSLLATKAGRVWIERVVSEGVGDRVAAPAAYFDDSSAMTNWGGGGFLGVRPREWVWGSLVPSVHQYELDGNGHDAVARKLDALDQPAVAQVWAALKGGVILAARRSRTLDVLVSAGVSLHVTAHGGDEDMRPVLPGDLASSLFRRTRFLCRFDRDVPLDRPTLEVRDLGWSRR